MHCFHKTMAAALAACLLTGTAQAQAVDTKLAEIAARQALMTLYAFNIGPLVEMDKGTIPYDAEAALGAANNIAALAMMEQTALWNEGSDRSYSDLSLTLPEIWAPDFFLGGKIKGLENSSAQLQNTAAAGPEAMQKALMAVNKSCNNCHKATYQTSN
jgi:cytochrome c556